ncbi:glycerate kinase [Thalassobacillus pellis]|uniref:glycerate kinase n=1 Tax=Thalassobacillus pellis TaxID=748008 RepID=UPI0019613BB6|nr:glycerate kinase [Thalassobacillus pellis]MBM7554474.1 glycerate kinase [Thalassobacillus pellis]
MKIIVAPDSFKGSLSAVEVSNSIHLGIKRVFPQAEVLQLPVADGGEGTMDTLVSATGGEKREATVVGPLGNKVEASYGILGDGETCVIEMASASGLALIPDGKLSPLKATTYGTGQLIKKALDDGFSSFILALGGSATNDGGAGMLQALGLNILDEQSKPIAYGGGELNKVTKIEMESFDERIKGCQFLIASDVQNPFIGSEGASHIFGPQKGATPDMVRLLDQNMDHWANEIEKVTGIQLHELPGAGAAGGIGGAFLAFFPSKMKRGIDIVLEHTGLIDSLKGTDLVITGEGQVDLQTASGKTPMGVAQAAHRENIPTVIIAGSVGEGVEILYQFGVVSVSSIINRPLTLRESMKNADVLLTTSAEQVVRSFFHHRLHREGGIYIEN